MLLGHVGPAGEDDVLASWSDVSQARTEMAHQALAFKAGTDARLYLGGLLFA
jgi:hypothetical protein